MLQFLGQFLLHMSHPSSMYFSNAYADTENFLMIPQCPGDIISVEYYLNRTFCGWRDAGAFWVWIQPHSFHLLLFRLFYLPMSIFPVLLHPVEFYIFPWIECWQISKNKNNILSLLLLVKWKGTLLKIKENLNTSQ